MRGALIKLSVVIAIATVVIWAARGASTRWWTQNRVQVKIVDPVTEIESPVWQDKFLPGLDFLGGGLTVAAALVVASRFIRRTTNQ